MKKTLSIIRLCIILLFVSSCKKSGGSGGLTSLNIIHAAVNTPSLYVYPTLVDSAFYRHQLTLSYGSSIEYGFSSGSSPLSFVSTSDTTQTLFKGNLFMGAGKLYSLYLIGEAVSPDTLFMEDTIPVHTDATAGLRFINLSPDSGPLTVNLTGGMSNEFAGTSYKTITPFKNYAATSSVISNGGYHFEIRNVTNTVVATFDWSDLQAFKDYTLVVSGLAGSQNTQVFEVHNY